MDTLKIAHIGTGRRGAGTYLPLISKLTDDLELVAVCDPHEERVPEQNEYCRWLRNLSGSCSGHRPRSGVGKSVATLSAQRQRNHGGIRVDEPRKRSS